MRGYMRQVMIHRLIAESSETAFRNAGKSGGAFQRLGNSLAANLAGFCAGGIKIGKPLPGNGLAKQNRLGLAGFRRSRAPANSRSYSSVTELRSYFQCSLMARSSAELAKRARTIPVVLST